MELVRVDLSISRRVVPADASRSVITGRERLTSIARHSAPLIGLIFGILLIIGGAASAQESIFSDGFEAGSICAWANLWYPDFDEDEWGDITGFGIPVTCPGPTAHADNNHDCDDGNPDIHPHAVEVCDDEDNDCDGIADDDAFCDFGWICCGGHCLDADIDPLNCGACGNVCDLPNTSTHVCVDGACFSFICNGGFGDCDDDNSNGCETDIDSDVVNCGLCGNICSLPYTATHFCSGGECFIDTCASGFDDCDTDDANGCETDIHSDPNQCGSCGNTCDLSNTNTHLCSGGQCFINTCDGGFDNCDGSHPNGCETNIDNDDSNCGSCGNSCNPLQSCVSGECI